MNSNQVTEIELLIRKNALKDVEIWLHQQYAEIDEKLKEVQNGQES
jgi:hypothetical protein